MKARQLQEMLRSRSGDMSVSEIDQRVRPLRENNLIVHGPRGRHAPDLTATEASYMLLSLVSPSTTLSFKETVRASQLTAVSAEEKDLSGKTLVSAISTMLETEDFRGLLNLEILDDGTAAWMNFEDHVILFTDSEEALSWGEKYPDSIKNQLSNTIQRRIFFHVGLLKKIAFDLNDNAEARYSSPAV